MRRVAWLLAVGCYHPNAAANNPCNDQLQCPDGQSCDTSQEPPTCVVGDAANPTDASLVDVVFVMPDAAIDAPAIGCDTANPCPATEPICDTQSNMCRGCSHDAECPDDVCVEHTGLCVAAADALYLDPAGGPGGCTQAAPCEKLDDALPNVTPTRRTFRLAAGTYAPSSPFAIPTGGDIVISGPGVDPAPIVTGAGGMGAGGDVFDLPAGASALIETIAIHGGGRDEVAVDGGTVTVSRVAFASQMGQHPIRIGRAAPGSVVTVEDSQLTGGAREGLHINGAAAVTVTRCTISGNANGGIWVQDGGQIAVSDTFVVSNGSASSELGGVDVEAGSTVEKFSFNTVASNQVLAGAVSAGLECGTPFAVDDSIFGDNVASNGTHQALGPMCTATYSLFAGGALPAGAGNVVADPMFLSTTDFHISGTSPARGAGDPAATDPLDVDGQPRPQPAGTARDIGADEVP